MKQRLLYCIAAVLWAGVIFLLSHIPDLATDLPSSFDLILRKGAHTVEYAILAVLVYRAVGTRYALWLTVLICTLYAASDEWHQTFVGGRKGSPLDMAIDGIGIVLGTVIAYRTHKSPWQR